MSRPLRSLTLLLALGLAPACDSSSEGYVCGAPSESCRARLCITSVDDFSFEDCCDSTVCNCNPRTKEWEVHACHAPSPDAGVDAPPDAAADAGADAAVDAL